MRWKLNMGYLKDAEKKVEEWKRTLGWFRYPLGLFFLLLFLAILVTPFTPGSFVALVVGLELLNIRGSVWEWAKRQRGKISRRKE